MMKSNLIIASKANGYLLTGQINEFADFTDLLAAPEATIILDLSGIQRINSYGIKKWILLLNQLAGKTVILQNCPICFVEQISLVPGMLGHGVVNNFFLPYWCPQCEKECAVAVSYDETRKTGFLDTLEGSLKCEACEQNLTFYDDIEIFFDFLRHNPVSC